MWFTLRDRLSDARQASLVAATGVLIREVLNALRVGVWERPLGVFASLTPDPLVQDVRSAARSLAATRVVSLATIATIALGIGASIAVFTIVYAALWRSPSGVTDAGRLVSLSASYQGQPMLLSYPRYVAYRDHDRPFSSLLAYEDTVAHLNHGDSTSRLRTTLASGNYFTTLQVRPALGRLLMPADDTDGVAPVAVVSHRVWDTVFGQDPGVVGRVVSFGGLSARIVGVAPARFHGIVAGASTDVWLPIAARTTLRSMDDEWRTNVYSGWLRVVGRLAPDETPQSAAAALETAPLGAAGEHPLIDGAILTDRVWVPLYQRDQLEGLAVLMLGSVGLVVVIVCANLAGLMLVRGSMRRRELTVRAALGATRPRIIQQLLAEGLVLAALGGALGMGLARLLVARLGSTEVVSGVRADGLDLSLDPALLLFAGILVVAAGLTFSLFPALVASRAGTGSSLRSRVGGSPGRRARSLFTIGQLGASVTLLVLAGTLLASIVELQRVDPGFEPAGVLRASVDLDLDAVDDQSDHGGGFISRVVSWGRVFKDTVEASAAADRVPLGPSHRGSGMTFAHAPDGRTPSAPPELIRPDGGLLVALTSVSERYHWTLRIPILDGRVFYEQDRAQTEQVAIVSQALADAYWPGERAVGNTLVIDESSRTAVRVVGVAGNLRRIRGDGDPIFEIYRPLWQRPARAVTFFWRTADRDEATASLLEVARGLHPDATIYDIRPLSDLFNEAIATEQLIARVMIAFAAIALCLAAIGLYGVLAQIALARRREFGIRLALGAQPRAIVSAVLRTAGLHSLGGIAIGLAGAWFATRALESQLPDLGALPPLWWAVIGLSFGAITVVSTFGPARSTTLVAPTEALRE